MTEQPADIFVFFFLAEYASIVLICIFTSILFLGGYLNILPIDFLLYLFNNLLILLNLSYDLIDYNLFFSNYLINASASLNLAIKSSFLIFVFIWVRASFPRIKFNQLMETCWTVLLPLLIAYIVLLPCIIFGLNIIPVNFNLL